MNKLKFVCVMCMFISALASCDNSSKSVALLQQATEIIEENPKRALALLDSISNPEAMDKNNYMKYIVANVQAKYKNYQDVTGDTLIFEAQHYFDGKSRHEQASLAHYYAGIVHSERKEVDKEFNSFLNAEYKALLSKNDLLIGRAKHSIANMYRNQYLDTIAIKYYHDALEHYEVLSDVDIYKLQVISVLGITYRATNQLDSAKVMFDKGLELSQECNNNYYQMQFYIYLGVVYDNLKNYDNSIAYFDRAIKLSTTKVDSARVFLNKSIVYNGMQRSDSSNYYSDLVATSLPHIKDKLVLRTMYSVLADYNTQIENATEAKRYGDLAYKLNQEIMESNSADVLAKAEQNFHFVIQQKETEKQHVFTVLMVGLIAFVFLIIGLILFIRLRAYRHTAEQEIAKYNLLEAKSKAQDTKMKGMMGYQSTFRSAAPQWQGIQKKVEELAEEYGAKEKPELYVQITQLVNELISNSEVQRIQWAKDYLAEYPFHEKLINKLNTQQQLLLVLCCCGFSKKHIASIMEIEEKKVHPNKLKLKHILKEEGFIDADIEQILFSS